MKGCMEASSWDAPWHVLGKCFVQCLTEPGRAPAPCALQMYGRPMFLLVPPAALEGAVAFSDYLLLICPVTWS